MKKSAYFLNFFHTSYRTMFEFFVIVAVFYQANPSTTSLLMGGAISLLGEVIRIWAAGYARRTSVFYIAGPYRFVRHPRYLGTFLLLLGLCIAARSFYVTAAFILGIIVVYRYYFIQEEKLLWQIAGPEFNRYRVEVPSFIPQLLPVEALAADPSYPIPRFSLNYAVFQRKRRELDSAFGLVLCFALLYLCMIIPSRFLFNGVFTLVLCLFLGLRVFYYRMKRQQIHATEVG